MHPAFKELRTASLDSELTSSYKNKKCILIPHNEIIDSSASAQEKQYATYHWRSQKF